MTSTLTRYLERVEIANFRAYGDSFVLSLPKGPGITLIHGPNGLGKTTFFDAVEWCLTGTISRFGSYLTTAAASRRTEHLTRFGAPEGSHRVSLYFSGSSPIDRGLGAAPTDDEIIGVLRQPDWPEVSKIGSYLSITHFLGQSAAQRFSVMPANKQWDALKGPAGVDRINHIRDRLGGQAARVAFTKRIRQAESDLEQARAALVAWRTLRDQLQRTRNLARVRDAASPSSVVEACTQLILALEPTHFTSRELKGDITPEAILQYARDVIGSGRELVQGDFSNATALEALAEELERIAAERSATEELMTAEVVREEVNSKALAQVEEQLGAARVEAGDAHDRVMSAQADVAQLLRLIEMSDVYSRDTTRAKSVSDELVEIETRIRELDAAHSEISQLYRDLTSRAARRDKLMRVAVEFRAVAQMARDVEASREEAERPFLGVDVPNAIQRATRKSTQLDTRQKILRGEIRLAESDLAEIDRRNEVLVALAGQIAGVLREEDTACPVCASVFVPGELLSRARAVSAPPLGSAHSAGERLAAAHGELAILEQELDKVKKELQRLETYRLDQADLADRERAVLVRAQGVIPERNPTSLGDVLQLADAYEQELAAAQLIAEGDRSTESCQNELGALETDRAKALERASMLRSESAKIAVSLEQARIVLAERADVWSETGGLTASVKDDQARAAADVAAVQARAETLDLAVQNLKAQETIARRRAAESTSSINALQQKRSAMLQRTQEIMGRWQEVAPTLDPSLNSAWQLRIDTEERERKLREAEKQLEVLVEGYTAWIDDAERQRLQISADSLLESTGTNSEDGLDAHYLRAVEDAQDLVARLERTRNTAFRIADELQHKADLYAQSVLQPLSEAIQSYSRALMTRVDESLFYRAHYSKNRSELRPGITRRNEAGSAVAIEMNPNLYFSEGQLSALSVSSLLAASTSFRWSCWPAVLMDDPLQHNDVIHASAFIDLLRRLVQKLNYQVILSTHDSDQAEFIVRKCESAGVEVQLCELRPTGGQGLVSLS